MDENAGCATSRSAAVTADETPLPAPAACEFELAIELEFEAAALTLAIDSEKDARACAPNSLRLLLRLEPR